MDKTDRPVETLLLARNLAWALARAHDAVRSRWHPATITIVLSDGGLRLVAGLPGEPTTTASVRGLRPVAAPDDMPRGGYVLALDAATLPRIASWVRALPRDAEVSLTYAPPEPSRVGEISLASGRADLRLALALADDAAAGLGQGPDATCEVTSPDLARALALALGLGGEHPTEVRVGPAGVRLRSCGGAAAAYVSIAAVGELPEHEGVALVRAEYLPLLGRAAKASVGRARIAVGPGGVLLETDAAAGCSTGVATPPITDDEAATANRHAAGLAAAWAPLATRRPSLAAQVAVADLRLALRRAGLLPLGRAHRADLPVALTATGDGLTIGCRTDEAGYVEALDGWSTGTGIVALAHGLLAAALVLDGGDAYLDAGGECDPVRVRTAAGAVAVDAIVMPLRRHDVASWGADLRAGRAW